jgi:cell division protein FtsB
MAKIKNTSSNIFTRVLLIVLTGSFLFFFFETVQTTYSSYTNLQKEIELNKAEKSEIQNQIADWNQQISDLDDPEKLEVVLRKRGYGKEGEILYIYDVPEPVTPIDEVLNTERSKTVFEYVVEFIVGQDGQ